MDNLEKIKHLIEHWIEHEQLHIAEYEEWAKKIGKHEDGSQKAAAILRAAGKLNEAVEILTQLSGNLLR